MSLYNIFVVNTAPGCDSSITQQVTVDGCTTYIVRLSQNSNALGPFDVYYGTSTFLSAATLYVSAQTRTQMFNGIVISFECVTPTPTPTPSTTPPAVTPTQTPTNSASPTQTPTNTGSPTQTPTNTETSTPTPTPSVTPGETPTQTPTITSSPTQTPTITSSPTQTPTTSETPTQTPTVTGTPTQTPTPSSTPPAFTIIEFTLQNGDPLLLQDGEPLLVQQSGVTFSITSGQTYGSITCSSVVLTQAVYSLASSWTTATRFYSDAGLSTPFNGNNLFYLNDSSGTGSAWQIDTNGYTSNLGSPC